MLIIARRISTMVAALMAVAVAGATAGAAARADYSGGTFAVSIDSPTVMLGAKAVIVATISATVGFRTTESYRHRTVNLSATYDGIDIGRRDGRCAVRDRDRLLRVA